MGKILQTTLGANEKRINWINVKDTIKNSLKKRQSASGQASEDAHPQNYEIVMPFIVPHSQHTGEKKKATNLQSCTNKTYSHSKTILANDDIAENKDKLNAPSAANKSKVITHPRPTGERMQVSHSTSTTSNYIATAANYCLTDPKNKPNASSKANKSERTHYGARKNVEKTDSKPPVNHVPYKYLKNLRNSDSSNSTTRNDTLSTFFKAMEETVRTFQLPLQIEMKGKISNLVSKYEHQNYLQRNNSSESLCSSQSLHLNNSNSVYNLPSYASTTYLSDTPSAPSLSHQEVKKLHNKELQNHGAAYDNEELRSTKELYNKELHNRELHSKKSYFRTFADNVKRNKLGGQKQPTDDKYYTSRSTCTSSK